MKTKWTGSIFDSSWYYNPHFAKYRQPGNLKMPFWLMPPKHCVGAAWYRKEVVIPADWKNKHIELLLERVHTEGRLWVDDTEMGMQNSMVAPHQFDLTGKLTPGKHTLSLLIDNRIKDINVGANAHSLTDHTQGNWNGVTGVMELLAFKPSTDIPVTIIDDLFNSSSKEVFISYTNGVPTELRRPATK